MFLFSLMRGSKSRKCPPDTWPRRPFLAARWLDGSRWHPSATSRQARGQHLGTDPYLLKYLIKSIDNLPTPAPWPRLAWQPVALLAALGRRLAPPQCSRG